jgi:hypothetical protein
MIADTLKQADFLEKHYTLTELGKAWHMSRRSLREWFVDEPGVLKFGADKLKKGRSKVFVSLRVPESVARRVYRRKTGQEVQPLRGGN